MRFWSLLYILVVGILLSLGTKVYSNEHLKKFKYFKHANYKVLLIGNNDYEGKDLDLRYAINDIHVFRQIFKNIFKVEDENIFYHENVNLKMMIEALDDFKKSIKKEDMVVITYTGHGDTNGMPILADRRTLAPKIFYDFMNGFENDTLLIMDSCYSGAEGSESELLGFESGGLGVEGLSKGLSKEVGEKRKYRQNVIRIYGSLANQEARENRYKRVPSIQKYLGNTYNFLEKIGYDGEGNGIFSILAASFFADQEFEEESYRFEDLNSHINIKVSELQREGFDVQRPKMLPKILGQFNEKSNNYLLYKTFKTRYLSEEERDYLKGGIAVGSGDYEGAIKSYKSVLQRKKNYKDVRERLSGAYIYLAKQSGYGSIDKSIERLNEAIKYNPNSLEGLNLLGKIYMSIGNYEYGKIYFKKILGLGKKLGDKYWAMMSYNYLGQMYLREGKRKSALKYFESGLKASQERKDVTNEMRSYNNIGELYFRQRRYKEAIKYFKYALAKGEDSRNGIGYAISLNNIGLVYSHKGDTRNAIRYLERAAKELEGLGRGEELGLVKKNIGELYQGVGNVRKSLEYYNEALEIYRGRKDGEKEREVLGKVGLLYIEGKNYIKGLGYLLDSLKGLEGVSRGVIDTWNNIGYAYSMMGKYKEGKEYLEKAKGSSEGLKYKEGVWEAKINLMIMYRNQVKMRMKEKEYDEALGYIGLEIGLAKEIGDERSQALGYSNQGYILYKKGEYSKALSFLEEGLKYSEKNQLEELSKLIFGYMGRVNYGLGVLKINEKKHEEGIRYLKRSLEIREELGLKKEASFTAENIGNTYGNLEYSDESIKYYEKSLKLLDGVSRREEKKIGDRLHYKLGVIYYNEKKYKEGYKYFNRINEKKEDTYRYLGYISRSLGLRKYESGKYKGALKEYLLAEKFLDMGGIKENILEEIYRKIALIYKNLGNRRDSILYQKRLIEISERLRSDRLDFYRAELKKIMGEKS